MGVGCKDLFPLCRYLCTYSDNLSEQIFHLQLYCKSFFVTLQL